MSNLIKVKFQNHFSKEQLIKQVSVKPEDKLKEIFESLTDEINQITEYEDNLFCENSDSFFDWFCEVETKEIINNFTENYSSNAVGFNKFDTLGSESIVDLLSEIISKDGIKDLILNHCSIGPSDYYIKHNEMASMSIGEYEHQIDVQDHDGLKSILDQLTDEELEIYNKDRSYSKVDRDSFCVYGNPCDRLIMKLDPETFLEEVSTIVSQYLKK